jgi:predicted ATPase/class 3 adenylate cyclase/DNA-binding CsgD family transcriptional regulator
MEWSELGVSELPTGTVTLLLADVEGSTRLWDTQPAQMTEAIALLDRTLTILVAERGGVRPVEQGEGDSFVVAFARASDAVACALDLQRAPLAPIRLRIGIHTGEVQLRDAGNYIGPTINRTARLRDLGYGGQILLSGAAEAMVADRLPDDAWLTELGSHQLRDIPRPERVVQLCHPGLRNDFPPLHTSISVAVHHLPAQLTSFVGRGEQIADLRQLLAAHRLVSLVGAGGTGKTRLATEVAMQVGKEFPDGAWFVDLAPITHPAVVPVTVARAVGLPDEPGHSTAETLLRFISDHHMLMVLDNCEHLIDATASLVVELLGACPQLTALTTSREPLGVAGEMTYPVPSLSLADEAIELFTDRARQVRRDFGATVDNIAAITEICRRLDGMPLAIELAAARARALSLEEIVDSLHQRFRLLTGGARTAVRRQQMLRASVDWSHALLTEPEQVLFRRLAVFLGGIDLAAAQAVAGGSDVERFQMVDQLTLLVDKSLVVCESASGTTRYRLLETVRQYAAEQLGESGEGDAVRSRHRDHYTALAKALDAPADSDYEQRIEQAEIEIDNLRAAYAWSRENSEAEVALTVASSLQPLWVMRGRIREGMAWFDAILSEENAHQLQLSAAARARGLADKALLENWLGAAGVDQSKEALAIARDIDEPALLLRALTASAVIAGYRGQMDEPYFAEAIGLAREIGDLWRLSQILALQVLGAAIAGDMTTVSAAAEEGIRIAEQIGDGFDARQCRIWLGWVRLVQGDLDAALVQLNELAREVETAHDPVNRCQVAIYHTFVLAYRGDLAAARATAEAHLEAGAQLGGLFAGACWMAVAVATLAGGDVAAAVHASEAAWGHMGGTTLDADSQPRALMAEAALASGDLIAARRCADEAVSKALGYHRIPALTTRARVAIAQSEPERAERDALDALTCATEMQAHLPIPDILDCLADLATDAGSHREAARLFGAAAAMRQRMGLVRFKIYQEQCDTWGAALRETLGDSDFDTAFAEGAALSTEEAIAYAQRGRGERKRPTTGWGSLTPAERDVVRLVSEGLANKDIATRLFISPRTVETHLTHVYTKLRLTSRVQLVNEATRHA